MGLPTMKDTAEGGPLPLRLRLWNVLGVMLEWLMAIAGILAFGMLFSTVLIPYWHELAANRTVSDVTAIPLFPGERTTTERPGVHPTSGPKWPDRRMDLPDIFDTSDWLEYRRSPRQQPFLETLHDLNFTRPVWRSADYRLSGDDVPSLYEVHLSVRIRGVDGAAISEFDGRSRTHFKRVGDASSSVELHVFGMYITTASLTCDGRDVGVVKHNRDNRKQTVIVTAREQIETGSECVLELVWTKGLPTTDNTGAYETWYTRDDGSLSVALTTHGESMHTRKWMPCFDEPKYRAPLKLSIEHPSDLIALSNARVVSIEKTGDDRRSLTSFDSTWSISSYLFAFSVTDYVKQETIVDGLPVGVYAPPPLINLLPKAMELIEEVIPLSLSTFKAIHINSKLDFVFFPDHSSAMENPGHISLGTDFMKKDTLLHEMMHQYFGNLITLDWWSDLWVNEGLGNYYEDVAMYRHSALKLLLSLRDMRKNSMRGDVYDTSIPLHNTAVDTFIESRMMFRKPYTKGAIVINMLRDYVGKDDFDAVIGKILNERANATLSMAQFYDFLDEIGGSRGENAVNIARDFMEQSGYPLLLVRHTKNATVIRQVRFHRGFVKEEQRDYATRWTIPIHLTTLYGTYTHTVVMEKGASEITVNHHGILIVDPSRVVNYRVVYDRDTYEAILRSPLSEEDKDFIELDLVEAASLGYTDPAATYDVILRRKSQPVVDEANQKVFSLFGTDRSKIEEARKMMERLSGHKLSQRQYRTILEEHPLRQRRDNYYDEIDKDDDEDEMSEEEEGSSNESAYCLTIDNMTLALKANSKFDKSGKRSINSLKCILERMDDNNKNGTKGWIDRLFDNHHQPGFNTFHNADRGQILYEIQQQTHKRDKNFVQDYIVNELHKKVRYFKLVVFNTLSFFTTKHLEQLKTLILNHTQVTAENWIDIANIFEQFHASNDEVEILGPKVLEALKKLTDGGEN